MDSILKASGSVFAQRCHSRHSGVSRSRGQVVQLRKLLFSTSSSFLPPTPASCRSHGRQIKKERKRSKGRKFPRGLFASPQSSVSDNDSGSHSGAILIEMEAVLRVSSAELTAHFASRSRKFRSASSEIGFCLSTLAIPPIPPPREGRRRGEASSPVRREGKQLWASERASEWRNCTCRRGAAKRGSRLAGMDAGGELESKLRGQLVAAVAFGGEHSEQTSRLGGRRAASQSER